FSRLVRAILQAHGFDWRTPWNELPQDLQERLLHGSDTVYTVVGENRFGRVTSIDETFEGFIPNLERRYRESQSDYVKSEIERFMFKHDCPTCHGRRLRPEALAITV